MELNQRWQDWATLVLGVWLFFAPFFMGYTSATDAAAWNSYVVGGLAAIFAASAMMRSGSRGEEWLNLLLGLWALAAPFVYAFIASEAAAAWNLFVIGFLIAGDALWALAAPSGTGTQVHHH